jgi:hypothetical protein
MPGIGAGPAASSGRHRHRHRPRQSPHLLPAAFSPLVVLVDDLHHDAAEVHLAPRIWSVSSRLDPYKLSNGLHHEQSPNTGICGLGHAVRLRKRGEMLLPNSGCDHWNRQRYVFRKGVAYATSSRPSRWWSRHAKAKATQGGWGWMVGSSAKRPTVSQAPQLPASRFQLCAFDNPQEGHITAASPTDRLIATHTRHSAQENLYRRTRISDERSTPRPGASQQHGVEEDTIRQRWISRILCTCGTKPLPIWKRRRSCAPLGLEAFWQSPAMLALPWAGKRIARGAWAKGRDIACFWDHG